MNHITSRQIDWQQGWSQTRLRDVIAGAVGGLMFFGIGAIFAAALLGFAI